MDGGRGNVEGGGGKRGGRGGGRKGGTRGGATGSKGSPIMITCV